MTEFFKRGRPFTIIMPKARKIRAAINRENISVVQQAIRGFLEEIEYAKKEEIVAFLRSNETLPYLVQKYPQRFCRVALKAPTFTRIKPIGDYDENNKHPILWKNNEEWIDWRTAYGARAGV